jgi:hypothetical protein
VPSRVIPLHFCSPPCPSSSPAPFLAYPSRPSPPPAAPRPSSFPPLPSLPSPLLPSLPFLPLPRLPPPQGRQLLLRARPSTHTSLFTPPIPSPPFPLLPSHCLQPFPPAPPPPRREPSLSPPPSSPSSWEARPPSASLSFLVAPISPCPQIASSSLAFLPHPKFPCPLPPSPVSLPAPSLRLSPYHLPFSHVIPSLSLPSRPTFFPLPFRSALPDLRLPSATLPLLDFPLPPLLPATTSPRPPTAPYFPYCSPLPPSPIFSPCAPPRPTSFSPLSRPALLPPPSARSPPASPFLPLPPRPPSFIIRHRSPPPLCCPPPPAPLPSAPPFDSVHIPSSCLFVSFHPIHSSAPPSPPPPPCLARPISLVQLFSQVSPVPPAFRSPPLPPHLHRSHLHSRSASSFPVPSLRCFFHFVSLCPFPPVPRPRYPPPECPS